ncbi:hypothetical protein [Alsobacter soli]|uniref:hypothetical protein n=1 Tax=Alsobacter soli TaxID=2109933 RepID=UPI001304AEFE|nr:hypothetical protein [Alsobacter soli]
MTRSSSFSTEGAHLVIVGSRTSAAALPQPAPMSLAECMIAWSTGLGCIVAMWIGHVF